MSFSQLLPRKVQLRAKKHKRCKQCLKVLIRPEPRFQQTGKMKFLVKQTAWYLSSTHIFFPLSLSSSLCFVPRGKIPRILVAPHPETKFSAEGSSRLLLTFTNPREISAKITLTPLASPLAASIVAQSFVLGPYNEYEVPDDEDNTGKLDPGVFHQNGNTTSIIVTTTGSPASSSPPSDARISLQVQIDYEGEQISFPVHISPPGAPILSHPAKRKRKRKNLKTFSFLFPVSFLAF